MHFHHTTLANGLQVIAELNDRAHSVAAGFFVKTGSRDESSERGGRLAFPRAHDVQGDAAARRAGRQPRLRPRRRQAQRPDLGGGHVLPRHLPARVPAAGLRRALGHPPPHAPRRGLRDREAGDHRRDPDVPGQPDVGGLRGGQVGALRRAPAGQQHPRHGRFDHGDDGRPDARLLRAAVQPGQHRAGLRRQGPMGAAGRAGRGALRRPGRAGRRPGRPCRPAARARSARSSAPRTSSRRSSASPTVRPWRAPTDMPPTCWPRSSATTPARGSTGP